MKQIAARTGLSVPTVGNVLGRSGHRYSQETREKVFQVARELGYRPNASAKAIRSGKFGCAALVVSRNRSLSDMPQALIEGLDDELVQHSMHLMIARLPDEEFTDDDFVPKVLRESMADGMILNYTHSIPKRMRELIASRQVPAVWVNAKLPQDCAYPDDRTGSRVAVEHLLALGHRRIAYAHYFTRPDGAPPVTMETFLAGEHYSIADRTDGYRDAMRAAALPPCVVGNDRFYRGADLIGQFSGLLSDPNRPTAVITYNFEQAEAAVVAAAGLGLTVPRDLSLITFDSQPWRGMAGLTASTMLVPVAQQGREAVKLLMQKIQKPGAPLAPVPVPFTFVPGDTVAPAR